RLAVTVIPASLLLVGAGLVDGLPRAVCWVLALTIDYGGLAVRGVAGWRVEPSHFAERHGLIIIIALGESIVALGVGAQGLPLGAEIIVAGLLGIAIAGALWWAYFDVAAIVAERRFKAMERDPQVRMARDSYTYLHLPMVAGIIVFAVGVKKTLPHVDGHLHTVEAFALCGGVALYLLALSAFKRRNVGSWNVRRLLAAALLVAAGLVDGLPRAACWVLALTIDYGGLAVRGVEGWRVEPGHFAERHGLIIIIALGESVVSIGVGTVGIDVTAGVVIAALLGMVVIGAMWWAYFDVVAIVAERRLRRAPREERNRIARDSYTYLHLPMVMGIVVFSIGVKETLAHPTSDLDSLRAFALCAGVALYLLALSAFKRRNIGSFNYPRLVAAAVLAALVPLAGAVPALLALGLVSAVTACLIAYEVTRYAEARDRIRHSF
ncbi:MAG: low temperature requirement protein A, partial [Thermoleophilaceae bacterium]